MLASKRPGLFAAPWKVRDAFGDVAALPLAVRVAFASDNVRLAAQAPDALRLLEAASARLAMFGSCAWFFDDVAGHEVALMLRLAARAIDLLGDSRIEEAFLDRLSLARSNDPAAGDAATVYRTRVLPLRGAARA